MYYAVLLGMTEKFSGSRYTCFVAAHTSETAREAVQDPRTSLRMANLGNIILNHLRGLSALFMCHIQAKFK